MTQPATAPRTRAPFRHDIVGSFLRTEPLQKARAAFFRGDISQNDLTLVEDNEIKALVDKQRQVGLKAVTDGEFRRSWWHLDFMWGLGGVEKAAIGEGYRFQGITTRPETARLTGRIKFGDHPFMSHFAFLKAAAGTGVTARQAIPAPAQFLSELLREENRASTLAVYKDTDTLLADIAAAYQDAIKAFYNIGCRSLQLDDCTWGMFCDKAYWEKRMDQGVDIKDTAQRYLDLNNAAIKDRPKDLALTTHVCRGNYRSTWATHGGYDPIAEFLFEQENVDAFYLEYDTDRAGDFAPLAKVPASGLVVLGLVSSKVGTLEDEAAVEERIREAARYLPLENLCLSPQCGFASTEEGNLLTQDQQWEKLKLVKRVADRVWGT